MPHPRRPRPRSRDHERVTACLHGPRPPREEGRPCCRPEVRRMSSLDQDRLLDEGPAPVVPAPGRGTAAALPTPRRTRRPAQPRTPARTVATSIARAGGRARTAATTAAKTGTAKAAAKTEVRTAAAKTATPKT